MQAFELPNADLTSKNDLDDFDTILAMPTEEFVPLQNDEQRQASIAQKKAEREHQLKLAEIKRQKDEEERRKRAEEARITENVRKEKLE